MISLSLHLLGWGVFYRDPTRSERRAAADILCFWYFYFLLLCNRWPYIKNLGSGKKLRRTGAEKNENRCLMEQRKERRKWRKDVGRIKERKHEIKEKVGRKEGRRRKWRRTGGRDGRRRKPPAGTPTGCCRGEQKYLFVTLWTLHLLLLLLYN